MTNIEAGPRTATPRRRGERTRTIPEQIADHVSTAIIGGEYRGGERIREQELATLYGVSRGPVREAIRALEQRGLVNFFPRRGAYAIAVTLDTIIEIFNVRAALMGLAVRDLARRKDRSVAADLDTAIAELRQLAKARGTPPERFARAVARCGGIVAARCGNQYLSRLLHQQLDRTLWGLIWRERSLDFFTPRRQQAALREWEIVSTALAAGRDAEAERAMRLIFFNARDAAIATLEKARGEKVNRAHLIKD
ncbi:GntR family transcriptional regulator [Bradyrhizobium sp. 2TAF24]|uniref:GntR family transcriptional regulator n=1 Tax=Bradyrhizobium sp. 2TAF24 TaxID=3233011 RepID=UPI003F8E69E4